MKNLILSTSVSDDTELISIIESGKTNQALKVLLSTSLSDAVLEAGLLSNKVLLRRTVLKRTDLTDEFLLFHLPNMTEEEFLNLATRNKCSPKVLAAIYEQCYDIETKCSVVDHANCPKAILIEALKDKQDWELGYEVLKHNPDDLFLISLGLKSTFETVRKAASTLVNDFKRRKRIKD